MLLGITNGDGGQSPADVEEVFGYLDKAFSKHNIFFVWDCHTNYIDNTDLYLNDDPSITTLISTYGIIPNGTPDGINMFLFPDDALNGKGLADDIPGTGFYVLGKQGTSSRVKSHVISHEMGHCLGLLHTHHDRSGGDKPDTGVECVNGSNCSDAGDCLCDTPADPKLEANLVSTNCDYIETGTLHDGTLCNEAPYTPDVGNIMSLTRDACLKNFTNQQGQRMRNIISLHLENFRVRHLINSTTTWDLISHPSGEVIIDGTLEVEPGATLTIDENITVKFARKGRLIVKPNAVVILEGTLTSKSCDNSCIPDYLCDKPWRGVQVWGSTSEYSQYIVNGERKQGSFIGRQGAVIENAEVGIQLWGPTGKSGGLLNAYGVTFRNNKLGIDYVTYKNFYPFTVPSSQFGKPVKYFSTCTECSFITDNNYLHEENFKAFVSMIGVDGPRFIGCTFENNYTPINEENIGSYGIGIEASSSEFTVSAKCNSTTSVFPCLGTYTRSEFKGLGYGIITETSNIGTYSPYSITQTDFRDCYVGVFNRKSSGSTLLFNEFFLGDVPNPALSNNQVGVIYENTTLGLTLEENRFTKVAGDSSPRTIGVSAYHIGSSNNPIRRNTFDGIAVGIEAGGFCGNNLTGLWFECNTNINITEVDFLVCNSGFYPDQIRKIQGKLASTVGILATGNVFSNTGTGPYRDFNNDEAAVELDYHYYGPAGAAQTPTTGEYAGIENLINSVINDCPETYCAPPCIELTQLNAAKQAYYDEKTSYLTALSAADAAYAENDTILGKQKLLAAYYHRQEMDINSSLALLHSAYDTITYHIDSMRIWLFNSDSYAAEITLAGTYLESGDLTIADSILQNIPQKFSLTSGQQVDLTDVQSIFSMLGNESVHALSENSISQLDSIAAKSGGFSTGVARSILRLYGYFFAPVDCQDNTRFKKGTQESKSIEAKSSLKVYPNPASDYVIFEFENKTPVNGVLTVVNAAGQEVWKISVVENSAQIRLETTGAKSGIYFYRFHSDTGIPTEPGRFVLIK
jgi:hypothetical protein